MSEKEQTTSTQLFNHLYEACNILRGPINQDEYKSYVTPILFFKRISDVYDEETVKALEETEGDAELAALPEYHSFVIPNGCHWNDVREKSENIGKAIVDAMTGIETENPDTLFGVFSSFDDANWTDKTKLDDARLKDLVEHFSKIKVGNSDYSADVMGDSYEFLIKKFADLSKKNAGEFYTPRSIVKLLVMLLDPKPGDTVYDPACGTGGMLIEAIPHINNDRQTYGKIFGQEKNLSTSAIARMNLFLHGAQDFTIGQADTLRTPLFIENNQLKTFNCVIANPPFSLESWGAESFANDRYGRNIWGCPSDSNGDFAWLQHMVKSMDAENGRCAVVLPQGVLFRSGKEGEIRKSLIESIYTPMRAQNVMTEENINEVFNLYKNYEDVIERVKIVSIEDLKAKDFSLSVSNYIEKKAEEAIDVEKVKKEYFAAVQEVTENEDKMKKLLIEGGFVND